MLGDGKLGLLIAMVLRQALDGPGILAGPAQPASHDRSQTSLCRLMLIGKHTAKMQLVEDLGVETMAVTTAQKLSREFDLLVEATGSPRGWHQALKFIKPRGTIVLKSTFHEQVAFNPAPLVVDEITVIGSRCGRFEAALELLERRRIHPARLLQYTLPLSRTLEAFELASQPGVLKVMLQPD